MLFNSWTFVIFLALFLLLYWSISGATWREYLLLLGGYVFYMAWYPPYGLLLAGFTVFAYVMGLAMERFPARKALLVTSGITCPLLLLSYFKYADFFLQTLNQGTAYFGHNMFPAGIGGILLPLAISFFTFEVICYLVDIFRGQQIPVRNFRQFAIFLAFFPKLISGPIVRPREFFPQLEATHQWDSALFYQGIHRFLTGLFLKIGIADTLNPYVSEVYSRPDAMLFLESWIATYAFAIQIFCDFAGYTAMALGTALMLGFRLPENFDAPYFATSIADFWRRWHMTLSRWLRDYLYIPLGGSRGTFSKTYQNLFITMTLGGLWHGASWTFVFWGMLHGLALIGHKVWEKFTSVKMPDWLGVFLTFHVVCLGWVFFRSSTIGDAFKMLRNMVQPLETGQSLSKESIQALVIVVLFFLGHGLIRYLKNYEWAPSTLLVSRVAFYGFVLVVLLAVAKPAQPFVYFQF